LTEAIDGLESDATGIYDTKPPYAGCGSEWVNILIKKNVSGVWVIQFYLSNTMPWYLVMSLISDVPSMWYSPALRFNGN